MAIQLQQETFQDPRPDRALKIQPVERPGGTSDALPSNLSGINPAHTDQRQAGIALARKRRITSRACRRSGAPLSHRPARVPGLRQTVAPGLAD